MEVEGQVVDRDEDACDCGRGADVKQESGARAEEADGSSLLLSVVPMKGCWKVKRTSRAARTMDVAIVRPSS